MHFLKLLIVNIQNSPHITHIRKNAFSYYELQTIENKAFFEFSFEKVAIHSSLISIQRFMVGWNTCFEYKE